MEDQEACTRSCPTERRKAGWVLSASRHDLLGSPSVSHLDVKSFLEALSSKAMEMAVATRRASLFLLRTTSAMVTQRAYQLFRCAAKWRIWQMNLDVTSSCSAARHDRGSLAIRHARSQSWGCGTLPLRSLSSSRVAWSVMHTGWSGLNQDLSLIHI